MSSRHKFGVLIFCIININSIKSFPLKRSLEVQTPDKALGNLLQQQRIREPLTGKTWFLNRFQQNGFIEVGIVSGSTSLVIWQLSTTRFVFGFRVDSSVYFVTCKGVGRLRLSQPEIYQRHLTSAPTDRVFVYRPTLLMSGHVLQPVTDQSLYIGIVTNKLAALKVQESVAKLWHI